MLKCFLRKNSYQLKGIHRLNLSCDIALTKSTNNFIRYYSIPGNLKPDGNFPDANIELTDSRTDTEILNETIELFPNLEGFYNVDSKNPSSTNTLINPKETPVAKDVEETEDDLNALLNDPFGMNSTDSLSIQDHFDSSIFANSPQSDDINRMIQNGMMQNNGEFTINTNSILPNKNSSPATVYTIEDTPSSTVPHHQEDFDLNQYEKFKTFLNHNDIKHTYDFQIVKNNFKDIINNNNEPFVIISNFKDPKLNLSIEKFIYDSFDIINKNNKKLFIYSNYPSIIIGKNQNPYKEINLKLSSNLSVPILRRFSGGGTVVHDLGNFNFSFTCLKDEFNRIKFSNYLIDNLNNLINYSRNITDTFIKDTKFPIFKLSVNSKGDIIKDETNEKLSGSAYQISKGKSLHHGTMLLNSNLRTLSKLLKNDRKSLIKDKSIDSIPSKVMNYNISNEIFQYCLVNAFTKNFGKSNIEKEKDDKTDSHIFKFSTNDSNLSSKVLLLDNINDIPDDVWTIYNSYFNNWNWIFGKTPKFTMTAEIEKNDIKDLISTNDDILENFKIKFDVEKGFIKDINIFNSNDEIINDKCLKEFKCLIDTIKSKDYEINKLKFKSEEIKKLIANNPELSNYLGWKIDYNINYKKQFNLNDYDELNIT
ncbi:unnamed protein product [[Candida] boidinii]|uniref:Unnamed protein product n=1 Tax=Candida boidinii TaxID=5477 RepID=A0ACB5TES8_CANBO|nr:unnamed protein product [[Candida] boidinii]